MTEYFEVSAWDGAGRRGTVTVPRQDVTVETPALFPVINPHLDTIEPAELESMFGAQGLITNAYILHGSDRYRDRALEEGLHSLYDFSGAIMTDSGSFQLSEYGDIDVTTEEILEFQRAIGSDIGTPVDVPTPPDVDRDRASEELKTTMGRLDVAAEFDSGDMLVSAPVQGSTYPDLRRDAGKQVTERDLDVFPIGAVVPLMNAYRYADLVETVVSAKQGLGTVGPVHLFGAGHPMMFALAAAMGCDFFDSAAYAIYARDDRYMTVRGTEHLEDLSTLPCSCQVCTEHSAEELRSKPEQERTELLAAHNLFVSFAEMRRIRQAIDAGNLLELVETRARSHPAMLDGYRRLLDYSEWLETTDPTSKDGFKYVSTESARRPEVTRHHDRLERLEVPETLVLGPGQATGEGAQSWGILPPFGPVPPELAQMYPLNAEVPDRHDEEAIIAATRGVARLASANPGASITLTHEGWPERALSVLSETVTCQDLTEDWS